MGELAHHHKRWDEKETITKGQKGKENKVKAMPCLA
jgi:hypothetical protein